MNMPHAPALQEQIKHVRFILNNLHNPLRLAKAEWASAALVAQSQQDRPGESAVQALRTHVDTLLMQLEQEEKVYADLLRGRFWEGLSITQMITSQRPVAQSERRFYLQQNAAIARFTQLLLRAEAKAQRQRHSNRLLTRLPLASYDQLFGVENVVNEVVGYLADADQHHILCIKGIGGIGKTALADQTVRRFVGQGQPLSDLFWITAKQEYLTEFGIHGQSGHVRLEQLFDELGQKLALPEVLRLPLGQKVEKLMAPLRAEPHLIVIDNLETIEDFRLLTPWLAKLAGPTKFLLTSRQTLPALKRVTTVELREMTREVAMHFITHTAHAKNALEVDAERLYNLVGGNPLAIILAVSQLAVAPEDVVYAGVRLGNPSNIYSYIYGRAWNRLDEAARELLFAIQRAGDQADWCWLEMICGMPSAALQTTLQQLLDLSLIQMQRDMERRRIYAIHRLTSTFLRTEVLAWK